MGSNSQTGTRSGTKITKATKTTNQQFWFVIFVLFVFFVAGRAPSAVAVAQGTSNWPQFRGNPRLTGIAASDVPANLSLKWTYEGGESFESSPAIADGVVYAAAGNGDILAIDLASGKLRWKRPTG